MQLDVEIFLQKHVVNKDMENIMSNRKRKISVSSVDEFVKHVTTQRNEIFKKQPTKYRKDFPFIYRGMGDAKQCLCPGIFRIARDEGFEAPLLCY